MARLRAEVEAVVEQAKRWPSEDRAALVEALMTPKLRLKLLLEDARNRVKVPDDAQIDRTVNRAVRRIRRDRSAR